MRRWQRPLVNLAQTEGIVLTVATRMGTLTELPDQAVALCQRVPGLGLTLDPSHYIAGPHQGANYDHVYPYVRHVHLRDTARGPGQFQVRIGQGEIEYGRIIAQLARHQYNRLLTVEIDEVPDAPYSINALFAHPTTKNLIRIFFLQEKMKALLA